LEGRVAIVTGGGRGLGRAIALTLAEAGADVVVASKTLSQLEETSQQVRLLERRCIEVTADVSNEKDANRLVESAVTMFGKVDILVNNAAVAYFRALIPTPGLEKLPIASILNDLKEPLSPEQWSNIWGVNVDGVLNCINAVVPIMIDHKYGKIINITSTAATKYTAFQSIYPATKAAVTAITRILANELSPFKINVNAIGPGMFITEMTEKLFEDKVMKDNLTRMIPLRRFGNPREVGLLAVYLASSASDYMTGQSLYIDGGYTAT